MHPTHHTEPMSFDQMYLLLQETTKLMAENRLQMAETDRRLKETDKQIKETDKQMKETDIKIDKLQATVSGIGHNNGAMAEEFFFNGLKNKRELFGIEYEHIDKFERHTKKLSGEYDIILFNGKYMIVIEVKYRLHPGDVIDFCERKLVVFRQLFPEYANKKVIGCIAAMSIPKESRDIALQHGLLLLTQSGETIKVVNTKNFKPNTF